MGYSYYDLEAMTGPLFPIVTMEEKIMKTIAKGALGALWTASALLACGGVTFAVAQPRQQLWWRFDPLAPRGVLERVAADRRLGAAQR